MAVLTPPPVHPVTYGMDASIATFSVARYQQMIDAGILTKDDKVELLEGYVVLKMPRNPRHDSSVQRIQPRLFRLLPPGWDLRTQLAITLTDSQPEPDFAVVRGDYSRYETRHPGPADIGLLIEVSDSSLQRDTADKTRIYARGGIDRYWVIDLTHRLVAVYTAPSGPGITPAYGQGVNYHPGDAVPFELDGLVHTSIPVADLVG